LPATLESVAFKPAPRLLRRLTALLWVVVVAIVVSFAFFASSLCITVLLAGFLAILVDPIPTGLARWQLSRSFSSALVVLTGMLLFGLLIYVSYDKTSELVDDMPEYARRIRDALKPLSQNIEKVQQSAGNLDAPPSSPKKVPEVRVRSAPTWPSYLIRGVGSVWGAIIVGGIVPFLTFFMLVRKSHLYSWLSTTFGAKTDIPLFVSRLSRMVRGFALGNLLAGSVLAAITVAVLLLLHLQGAMPLGIASGFLNLIPFFGVIAATLVPILPALLQFHTPGPFAIICVTVVALHFFSANFLIPKFIGSRVNIGPVAATVGMLFWGWLWGLMGVLLAVPLTASVKLIADCHPSLIHISNLLAETPRPVPKWAQTSQVAVIRAFPFLRKRMRVAEKD
jgi:predicted PurR-regulated permease PerM